MPKAVIGVFTDTAWNVALRHHGRLSPLGKLLSSCPTTQVWEGSDGVFVIRLPQGAGAALAVMAELTVMQVTDMTVVTSFGTLDHNGQAGRVVSPSNCWLYDSAQLWGRYLLAPADQGTDPDFNSTLSLLDPYESVRRIRVLTHRSGSSLLDMELGFMSRAIQGTAFRLSAIGSIADVWRGRWLPVFASEGFLKGIEEAMYLARAHVQKQEVVGNE